MRKAGCVTLMAPCEAPSCMRFLPASRPGHARQRVSFCAQVAQVAALLEGQSMCQELDLGQEDGYTPLMAAAGHDRAVAGALTRALLEAGASATPVDHDGFSAVHWAAVSPSPAPKICKLSKLDGPIHIPRQSTIHTTSHLRT
jgi:hypothetical protein